MRHMPLPKLALVPLAQRQLVCILPVATTWHQSLDSAINMCRQAVRFNLLCAVVGNINASEHRYCKFGLTLPECVHS